MQELTGMHKKLQMLWCLHKDTTENFMTEDFEMHISVVMLKAIQVDPLWLKK